MKAAHSLKMLTAFYSIGENKGAPRLWMETERLAQLGMPIGTPLITSLAPNGRDLTLTAAALGDRHVSRHRAAGGYRPTIDINNRDVLSSLQEYGEVRVRGTHGRLAISPSIRATHIHTQRHQQPNFPFLECFAGGGFLGEAFSDLPEFVPAAAVEIEPSYADEYARRNPKTELFLGDVRKIHPDEFPPFVGLIAGLPCSDHAPVSKGLSGLKGTAELGNVGALFIPVLEIIAHRYPLFAVLECVPSFGRSLAGRMTVRYLQDLGYETHPFVMQPNLAWGEPTTRNRWVCIATLRPGFNLRIPNVPFTGKVRDFLDKPDPEGDRADAEQIAKSVAGLRRHSERHMALGHRFMLNVLTGEESCFPTITRSYYKVNCNSGLIATPWGPRRLRKAEIERLHGHRIITTHYATAVQISGQSVLKRPFNEIARQLAAHLVSTQARLAA